jgi:hypothetical protein
VRVSHILLPAGTGRGISTQPPLLLLRTHPTSRRSRGLPPQPRPRTLRCIPTRCPAAYYFVPCLSVAHKSDFARALRHVVQTPCQVSQSGVPAPYSEIDTPQQKKLDIHNSLETLLSRAKATKLLACDLPVGRTPTNRQASEEKT